MLWKPYNKLRAAGFCYMGNSLSNFPTSFDFPYLHVCWCLMVARRWRYAHNLDWSHSKTLAVQEFIKHNLGCTVEPHYNEDLGTMKITLLYQVSHCIRVKKQRNIKSWDQQNDLVIRGFCYIRPLYNEVPLYLISDQTFCSKSKWLYDSVQHYTIGILVNKELHIQWNLIITRTLGPWKLPCYNSFLIISGSKKQRNIKSWDQQNKRVRYFICACIS